MLKTQRLTREFMEKCALPVSDYVTVDVQYDKLIALVREEYEEYAHAMVDLKAVPDGAVHMTQLTEVIDAMCDLIVVIHNTSNAMGIDLEPFFDEVHKKNMEKSGGPKREDGKQLKPAGWTSPDHARILSVIKAHPIFDQFRVLLGHGEFVDTCLSNDQEDVELADEIVAAEVQRYKELYEIATRCECGGLKPGGAERCVYCEQPPSIFERLAADIGKLVTEKNIAYGDSVRNSAKIMRILYPDGISYDQIPTALLTVRVLDKLSRLANDKDFNNEDPAQDIAGYGLLLKELFINGL